MWQAIKRFYQAYLEAKGNRLHAEAQMSRDALCQPAMSVEAAGQVFRKQAQKKKSSALFLQLCEIDERYN